MTMLCKYRRTSIYIPIARLHIVRVYHIQTYYVLIPVNPMVRHLDQCAPVFLNTI